MRLATESLHQRLERNIDRAVPLKDTIWQRDSALLGLRGSVPNSKRHPVSMMCQRDATILRLSLQDGIQPEGREANRNPDYGSILERLMTLL